MKNVTDNLKPSESTQIGPVAPSYFDKDEFEVSYNDFHTNPWNKKSGFNKAALDELMAEAKRRGYQVTDSVSNETRVHYVKFFKPYKLRGKPAPSPVVDAISSPAVPRVTY